MKNPFKTWKVPQVDQGLVILTIFLILALVGNMSFLYVINRHMAKIEENLTFDIDKARNEFIDKGVTMFMRGCADGIDYPPAYRTDPSIFNPHAPSYYCHDQSKWAEDYLTGELATFAKREKK